MARPELTLTAGRITVALPGAHRVASWALAGGGLRDARAIMWQQVTNSDLGPAVDPATLLERCIRAAGLDVAHTVGLMTSAAVADYTTATACVDGIAAMCVATVGLSNALAVGDPPSPTHATCTAGTINVAVWTSVGLGDAALLEALSIAAEARTWAVSEAAVPSTRTGRVATGTGTDCIAIAAPANARAAAYAGKHTPVGSVIGQCVTEAVGAGIAQWRTRRGLR